MRVSLENLIKQFPGRQISILLPRGYVTTEIVFFIYRLDTITLRKICIK